MGSNGHHPCSRLHSAGVLDTIWCLKCSTWAGLHVSARQTRERCAATTARQAVACRLFFVGRSLGAEFGWRQRCGATATIHVVGCTAGEGWPLLGQRQQQSPTVFWLWVAGWCVANAYLVAGVHPCWYLQCAASGPT